MPPMPGFHLGHELGAFPLPADFRLGFDYIPDPTSPPAIFFGGVGHHSDIVIPVETISLAFHFI